MRTTYLSKTLFAVFFSLTINYAVKAQTAPVQTGRAQDVFFEFGAAGLFYSVNYDTRFSQQRDGWGARLGVGYWNPESTTFFTVPLQVNYLIGNRHSALELGAGATLLTVNKPYPGDPILRLGDIQIVNSTILPTTTIGYRYRPLKNGVGFGVSLNPMLLKGVFIPYFGASLGYTF